LAWNSSRRCATLATRCSCQCRPGSAVHVEAVEKAGGHLESSRQGLQKDGVLEIEQLRSAMIVVGVVDAVHHRPRPSNVSSLRLAPSVVCAASGLQRFLELESSGVRTIAEKPKAP